ncbi:hypothetical protein FOCC_FOCC015703 [Frankliniella occidentalis]|nr:hypothetical protein FOCC_FOCC015703 [Frankliniella occidentalis]
MLSGGIEERDEIFSSSQLSTPSVVEAAPAACAAPAPAPLPAAAPAPATALTRPQSVTASLFKSVPQVLVEPPDSPAPPADIRVNQYIRPESAAGAASFTLSPSISPSLSPALSPALSQVLSPALSQVLSPDFSPNLSPALSPSQPDPPLLRPISATSRIFASSPSSATSTSALSPAPASPSSSASSPTVFLRPQAATTKIFAPRTEDMNKGFLIFSEDEGLTMLKDEPEDLTHLAPTAGDVCVPLEGPFLGDVFDDFMLSENYCPLLSDDNSNSKFFLYRDNDPTPGDLSPPGHCRHLLSPTVSPTLSSTLSESPGDCSLPSLCSPSRAVDLDDNMSHFMSLSVDTGMTSLSDTDDDLSLRAPYIPMGEDLPLIMSNDLMWGSSLPYKSSTSSSRSSSSSCPDDSGGGDNSNSSINSPLGSSRNCWSPQPQTSSKPDMNSSLARLLQSDTLPNGHRQSASDLVDPCEVLGQIYSKKQSPAWSSGRGPGRPSSHKTAAPPHTHKRGSSAMGQYLGAKRSRLNVAGSRSKKAQADLLHSTDSVLVLDGGGHRPEHKSVPLPQPSDSVLMNLLVSGCDVSAGYICIGFGKNGKLSTKV